MSRFTTSLLLALLGAAFGKSDASAQGADLDACSLLTKDEIQTVAGWAPDTMIGKTHGTTRTCAIHGVDALKQSVVLIVARPAPAVSSSAQLAERRTRDAARSPEIKIKYTPVEGLGVPAVRTEVEGSPSVTLETVVGKRVLSVTAAKFDAARALASKAIGHLR